MIINPERSVRQWMEAAGSDLLRQGYRGWLKEYHPVSWAGEQY